MPLALKDAAQAHDTLESMVGGGSLALAASTNHPVNALQVPVDPEFEVT